MYRAVAACPPEREISGVRRRVSLLAFVLLPAAWAAGGCDTFDSERRPYTPFATATGAPASPPPAPEPTPPPAALEPRGSETVTAPARAKEWQLAGRNLLAPEGLIFRMALVGGPTPERHEDVLAWLIGTADRPVIGELWLFPMDGQPRLIAAAPSFLPTGPGCTHAALLRWTGRDAVTLDIQATCSAPLLPRAPQRSVSVLSPWRSQPKVAGFQLAGAAPGERLDVELATEDRDRDGRDDIELSLAVAAPSGDQARARVVWLDRTAGLSRDTTEPSASFRELARLESARAASHKSSSEVADRVASIRRLYASLCAESGTARIFMEDGGEISCGSLVEPFQALTAALIQAELSLGRPERGFAALEQHRWYAPAGAGELERFTARQLSLLTPRIARRRVIKLVPLKAQPRLTSDAPHLSPLSFHADGSLLLLTPEGLVRAAPDGRFEYDASDEIDAWATELTSPSGERLTGLAFPCDRSEVSWLLRGSDGSVLPPVPTPLIAPRPGQCRPAAAFRAPPTRPAAWGPQGISAFVGAALLGPPPASPPLGSAFSPNGRHGMASTPWGLLVTGSEKPALWVFEDAALGAQLSDCVVSNNAQAAACIMHAKAFVILPDPKS